MLPGAIPVLCLSAPPPQPGPCLHTLGRCLWSSLSTSISLGLGFWLWQVRSLEEALEWAQRAPFAPGDVLELRPLMAEEDFGEAFTAELREKEQRLREHSAAR